jgi:divalent metal cation (Fe/Co/Zn/Cd) transporter
LLISATIIVLLWGTVRSIGGRLMDAIEPELVHRVEHALLDTPGVNGIADVQLRWVGHRLQGAASVTLGNVSLAEADARVTDATQRVRSALPNVDAFQVRPTSVSAPTT